MPLPDVAVVGAASSAARSRPSSPRRARPSLLVERDAIAAGASGRNSGIVQHPMDAGAAARSSPRPSATTATSPPTASRCRPSRRACCCSPRTEAALAGELAAIRGGYPELAPEALGPGRADDARAGARPARSPACGCTRATPCRPAAATAAFAARAAAAGAEIADGRGRGARAGRAGGRRAHLPAGAVVVAAGPVDARAGRPDAAPGGRSRRCGASTSRCACRRRRATRSRRSGIEQLVASRGDPPPLFSLVTAGGTSSLGSTFLPDEPDAAARRSACCTSAARASCPRWPARRSASVRACARPQSADGRPLLGRAPGRDDVFVAAGHGPWGISLGPASARLVADLVLGREPALSPAFDPARFA